MANTSTIGARLRAAWAGAKNPLTQPPLSLPPAWVTATAYKPGNVVTNGGNEYLAWLTAGNTAAGPSGTGAAGIVDGGVTWLYNGPTKAASGVAPTFTITGSAPGGLTNIYTFPAFQNNVFVGGGVPTIKGGGGGLGAAAMTIQGNGNMSAPAPVHAQMNTALYDFWSNAPLLALSCQGTLVYQISISDQLLSRDAKFASNFFNNFNWANDRSPRHYRLYGQQDFTLFGVYVDPASTVWAGKGPAINVAVIGDSIVGGGNGMPTQPLNNWTMQLALELGWNVTNMGQGGVGYTATNGGTAYNLLSRLSTDLTNNVPDVIIVFSGTNDVNLVSSSVAAEIAYLRSLCPNALIIVMGRWANPAAGGSANAAVIASEAAIINAANAAAVSDPLVKVIPLVSSVQGSPVTGTGNVSAPTGSGSADIAISPDQTHPMEPWMASFAHTIAAQVKYIINTLP